MEKILILSTGGTISQKHSDGDVAVSDKSAFKGATFSRVLSDAKEKLGISTIDSKTILNKDSSNIISEDWVLIVNEIIAEYDNYDAFIITHGTNTMGYTSAAVSFAIGNLGKPIVLTGSQVSYGIPGSDATTNLENVLRFIKSKENLAGVFLVFASKIITGTRVKKKTEFDYDAFKTFGRQPDIGLIGNSVAINEVALKAFMRHLGTRARLKNTLDVKNRFNSNIVSLTEFPGLKPSVIINLAKSGVKGFILRATGAGDPNIAPPHETYENLRSAFEYLQEYRIPIVVTTQAPDGVASMQVNEPGVMAKHLGAIPAWDMSMEAMVTKLSWLIANDFSYEDIQRLMVTSLRGEIDAQSS